uniref:Uncharacterized protein n=1 Tax=Clytia hemisphaerica TaxID=252671 RepID=A0A7M5UV42_9CNID
MWLTAVPLACLLVATLSNGLSIDGKELANQKRGRYSYSPYPPVNAYIRRLSMDYLRRIKFLLASGGRKASKRSASDDALTNAEDYLLKRQDDMKTIMWGREASPMLSREADTPMLTRSEDSPMLSRDVPDFERDLNEMFRREFGSPMLSKKSSPMLSKRSVENIVQENKAPMLSKKSSPMLSKKTTKN